MRRKLRYYELEDASNDKEYYIVIPQLVWALSRNTYDFTLWCIIKMIAGEHGTCWVSTENLSHLAMMSMGQISDSRKYLLEIGLLIGEIKAPKGFKREVWHLKVPDVWAWNISWRQEHQSISKRIEFKKQQREMLKKIREEERG